ncbi:MAG: ribosomal L7Ae/L30e/S12e/Gadd45 family protein [Bacillota bacterium]|nr:ribosomal L7Ae/L30e/S12e/Gadd45 family protein [Bacillota bacterium]
MAAKFLQRLGFAQKAGAISSGTDTVRKNIKNGKAKLVIGAADLSERLWKDVEASCKFNSILYVRAGSKLELGNAIGKSPRGLIAVMDIQFAHQLIKSLDQ